MSKDAKMRIAFVNLPIEYYTPASGGAIATIIAQTTRELVAAGHEVSVLTPVDGNAGYPFGRTVPLRFTRHEQMRWLRQKWSGLRWRWHGWDWPGFDAYLWAVKVALRQLPGPPDAIVVFNDLVTQRYLRHWLPNAVIVCWLQNEWRTRHPHLADVVAATDRFMTCSRYIADWTAHAHGIDAGKFAVVHSGVNLEEFTPSPDPSPRAPLRVLFVGRLDPNKGPDLVADAVAALRRERLDVTLTVAGAKWFYGGAEDAYTNALKAKLAEVGADYLGHVPRDRVAAVFRSHDVACVPSRSNEPFGLVALEAMASGCAVIASDRGGLPEACDGAAVLIDPDAPSALVDALRGFANDRDALAEAKRRAVSRAGRASWQSVARQVECVLRKARFGHERYGMPAATGK